MTIHPLVSLLMAEILYLFESPFFGRYIDLVLGKVDQVVPLSSVLGPLTYLTVFLYCLIQAIVIKYCFYKLIGLVLGLEAFSSGDDFWLLDFPINPINVPSYIIFKKTDKPIQEAIDYALKNLKGSHRMSDYHCKILGKYFVK